MTDSGHATTPDASLSDHVIAIIPAYNEAGWVVDVVRGVRAFAPRVVVVDDGSTDGTGDEARAASAEVIVHPANHGKGAAIITGLEYARGAAAVQWFLLLDGDGQHDPAEIPKFLSVARSAGADVVLGNRLADAIHMPWERRWANRVGSWLVSCVCRRWLPDTQCGYRLLHSRVVDALRLQSQRYEVDTEILLQAARAGHRIVSVPIRAIYTGQPSYIRPWTDLMRFLRLIWRYRFGRGLPPSEPRQQ
jgi:glycosyltransferase involved in cell wall biosynthesis